ncbi:aspartate aminotransferase family protein [Oceanibacterium hippocampi]|uniref:L-Lysine-8-amino-7-oxononanoate aminotransferase n=1 Tax=Oceanibacterium hippocampi TaxID=745714 RepID=A0A1Y5TZU1_9PROT|nr:aspartate aminotransferase family protein [Oceanibacterium hippocampi]SLN72848.1 L-Lysine-8-amino-7-oxononanoate aminotransferase [Oceanibacterium hippocampi]
MSNVAASIANSPARRDIDNLIHPYTNLALHEEIGPLIIERGEGVHVFDSEGRQYIEGLAGLWCTSFGFNENELIEAAIAQMRKLPTYHGFGHKSVNPAIDLAEKLKAVAPVPFSHVFFANSGSEANDTVIKLVWYFNNSRGRPEKKKIISRIKGYHGVTVAAASLTGLAPLHADFDLPIARILHTSCPHHYRFGKDGESEEDFATRCAEELEAMIQKEGPETVAAFIAEPVMGAGGVIVPPKGYFEKIQAVLKRHDILMIADEVICGFGRTGNFWGSQTFGIKPDILTCAKQLSSAYLPISAVLVSEDIYQAMLDESRKQGAFAHGFTYSGHPVPAAVGLRTLQLMEERDIMGHVRAVAPRFQQRLKALGDHPLVGETRGVGLIAGIELVADKASHASFDGKKAVGPTAVKLAQGEGLISRAVGGDTLALCPPLIVTEEQIDAIFDRMEAALDKTEAWVKAEGLR